MLQRACAHAAVHSPPPLAHSHPTRLTPTPPPSAGLVAIPRAFLSLGALLGTALLLAAAALVLFTMDILIAADARWRGRGESTYAAVAAAACGRWAALATRASVILFCFGFLVVDLVRGDSLELQV